MIAIISIYSYRPAGNRQKMRAKELKDSIEYLTQARQFIQQVKQTEINNSSFILTDRPASLEYFDCLKNVLSDTTTYSEQERTLISNETKKSFITTWTTDILPKIKIINSDTIKNIFKSKSGGWNYFYKHIGQSISSFSSPVFLKNYTLCLFYSDNMCGGLCGYGSLILYKKEGNQWMEVKSYCNWVS